MHSIIHRENQMTRGLSMCVCASRIFTSIAFRLHNSEITESETHREGHKIHSLILSIKLDISH